MTDGDTRKLAVVDDPLAALERRVVRLLIRLLHHPLRRGDIRVDIGVKADAVVEVVGADFVLIALVIADLDVPALGLHMLRDGPSRGASGVQGFIGNEHEALEPLHIREGRFLRLRLNRSVQGDVGQLRTVAKLRPGGPAVVDDPHGKVGLRHLRYFDIHGDTGQGGEIHARRPGQG